MAVIEARDLAVKDSNGLADPYCVLALGKNKQRTTAVSKTLNPRWEQLFFLCVLLLIAGDVYTRTASWSELTSCEWKCGIGT